MREKTDRCDQAAASEEAAREVGAAPAQDRAASLVDSKHEGDEGQNRDELQHADHAAHHASRPTVREASEVVGRRLGHLLRLAQTEGNVEPSLELNAAAEDFIFSRCSTTTDALAVVATARRLLAKHVGRCDLDETGEIVFDAELACIVDAMLRTSIATLERITGTPAAVFTGDGPALN